MSVLINLWQNPVRYWSKCSGTGTISALFYPAWSARSDHFSLRMAVLNDELRSASEPGSLI